MARLPSLLCCLALLTGCPETSRTVLAPERAPADEGQRALAADAAPAPASSPRQTGGPNPPGSLRHTGGPTPFASLRHTGGPNQPVHIPDPPWTITEAARFSQPWAMTFLPDGRLLVTEKPGRLRLLNL